MPMLGRRSVTTLVESMSVMRRYAALPAIAPRFLSLFPDDIALQRSFIDAQFAMDGGREVWLRNHAALPALPGDLHGLQKSFESALRAGDLAAAEQVLADPRLTWLAGAGGVMQLPVALFRAELSLLRGDQAAARKYAADATTVLRAGRWSPRQESPVRIALARARVCAGEAGGVAELQQAVEQLEQRDKFVLVPIWVEVAHSLAAAGHTEEALACLRRSCSGPSTESPNQLRNDPYFAKLKSDPRFEEILKSAKPL